MCFSFFPVLSFGADFNNKYYIQSEYNADIKKNEINFGDNVDLFSGNLTILNKDISIPGNGGLDINVYRTYNMQNTSGGLLIPTKNSYEWSTLGHGWELRAAPKLYVQNYWEVEGNSAYLGGELGPGTKFKQLCSEETPRLIGSLNTNNAIYIELETGGIQSFLIDRIVEGYSKPIRFSKANWGITCIAGNIIVLSPNGMKYEYGNIDSDLHYGYSKVIQSAPSKPSSGGSLAFGKPPPTDSETYMLPLKVIDKNNNSLKFEYKYFGERVPIWNTSTSQGQQIYERSSPRSVESPSLQLTKITSNDGREINFSYDNLKGRLEKITDNLGRVWNYEFEKYDVVNMYDHYEYRLNLSKVIYPNGQYIKYKYQPNVQNVSEQVSWPRRDYTIPLSSEVVAIGKLISIENNFGGIVNYNYTYDNLNINNYSRTVRIEKIKSRVYSNGDQWQYNYTRGSLNNYDKTEVINPDKSIDIYKYLGASFNIWQGVGIPPYGGAPFQNTAWKIGNLIYKESLHENQYYEYSPRVLDSSRFIFSELGTVVDEKIWAADLAKKIVMRDGATYVTEYKNYDEYGNPRQVIETGPNGENRTTDYTYYNDIAKWIIGKPKDDVTYNGTTKVGEINRTYDSNGNLLSENKDGLIDVNTYDAQGNVATAINANGATTTYSNYKRGIAQKEVQPEGVTITRVVDNAGNITSETNGAGYTTSYTYDGLDRVTSITPPIGDKTTITYTPTSKTTMRGNFIEVVNYDEFGRPKDITKGGIKTAYVHDSFDNKTFESNPGSDKGTTISYDALNRVKAITNADNTKKTYNYGKANTSIVDEKGKITTYNYRSYGNPDEQHLMGITAPVTAANVTLTRNGRDLVTSVKQGNLTRTYGYNSKYQLISLSNPETGTTVLGRDNVGNMTSIKVGTAAATTLSYDGRNRNTQITYPSGTAAVTKTYTKTDKLDSVDNTATTRKYTYDANDNLKTEALTLDSKTFTTTYAYNGKDQLSTIIYPQSGSIVDYAPDALGRPTKVGNYITSISYWPSGQFKQLNYANGAISNYGQDTRLRPSSFDTKKGTTTHLNSSYSYDGVGNLLSIVDSTDSIFNRTATYDDINRLITAQGPWGTGEMSYDGIGNITKQSFGSQVLSYAYNATTNKLNSTTGFKVGTYSYDALGNITSDGTNTYSYNAVPSLICAKCNDSVKRVDYGYDGLNKRVSVTKGGEKRYEILTSNGDQLIEFIPSQNNKLTEYFYLGGKRIAQRVSP